MHLHSSLLFFARATLKQVHMTFTKLLMCTLLFPIFCLAYEYPDLGGVLDFSKPENISNHLFVLTNPKSGSHLLLYSIMKITQRPMRIRTLFWHFQNNPYYFDPENLMNYPVDFSKPTTYWGHEYDILKSLNINDNKLIFILRNYKENIASQLTWRYSKREDFNLERFFHDEIVNEGDTFKEYISRLQLFDDWQSNNKYIVLFEDLLLYPNNFVPNLMSFIRDDSDYKDFINHYEEFKSALAHEYYGRKFNSTGSKSDNHFFSKKISPSILEAVDHYVRQYYPHLWETYLKGYAEK